MVDPAQQRHHDQDDDAGRDDEENHAAGAAIGAGAQRDDADEAVEEGADERRQHVLGGRILHHQAGRARRDVAGRGRIGRHHRAQRERGDRQHARRDDAEDVVDRVGADLGRQVAGDVGRQHDRRQRGGDRQDREQAGAKPHPPGDLRDRPQPARRHDSLGFIERDPAFDEQQRAKATPRLAKGCSARAAEASSRRNDVALRFIDARPGRPSGAAFPRSKPCFSHGVLRPSGSTSREPVTRAFLRANPSMPAPIAPVLHRMRSPC